LPTAAVATDQAFTTATTATTTTTATANSTVSTSSDSSISLFRLPLELRDYIYTYISLTEPIWIGSAPLAPVQQDVVVEKKTMRQPATFVKTHSSIILASSEVRDEFRTAVWRSLMESDRQTDLRLYDFTLKPISSFFASCSPHEVQKLLEKEDCRVHIHLTGAVDHHHERPPITSPISGSDVLIVWVSFCCEIGLEAKYSFDDECDSYDLSVVERDALSERYYIWTRPRGSRHHPILLTRMDMGVQICELIEYTACESRRRREASR
jgi:hypothetical protein